LTGESKTGVHEALLAGPLKKPFSSSTSGSSTLIAKKKC